MLSSRILSSLIQSFGHYDPFRVYCSKMTVHYSSISVFIQKITWFPPLLGLMNTSTGFISGEGSGFSMNGRHFDSCRSHYTSLYFVHLHTNTDTHTPVQWVVRTDDHWAGVKGRKPSENTVASFKMRDRTGIRSTHIRPLFAGSSFERRPFFPSSGVFKWALRHRRETPTKPTHTKTNSSRTKLS